MKSVTQIAKEWIKDVRGVATSLVEATATLAVGAVLVGVAITGGIDAINDSKIQAAISDVQSIGQGVLMFYKDNAFFPLYKSGRKTGSDDAFFDHLVSENGTYPTDATVVAGVSQWAIPFNSGSATPWLGTEFSGVFFGHRPDYTRHDTIEGHLMRNQIGGPASLESYPLRGAYSGDPQKGWAGPYIASLPKTDPWNNKYLVNIRELQAGHLLDPDFSGVHGIPSVGGVLNVANVGGMPKMAVIVLSAGPDRTIETPAEQQFNAFRVYGDDIVFRIK